MLQKIFSVKNKKNHKIVRILGIKLKFRISEKNMISSQKPVKLYDIKGQNNQIIIVENGNENIFDNIEVIDGLKIVINGSNNTIKLHKPFNLFNNVFIEIGNDIDSFVKENNLNIGFIKADVEGQIIPLIKGAKNTIQKHRPVLCLAIYHSPQEFFEAKPLLEEIVENADYKLEIQSQCPFCDGISSIVIFAYPKELNN